METKSIFKSRTFWVNALTIASMILAGLVADDNLWELVSKNPKLSLWIPGILSAVNIILRTITESPVNILPSQPPRRFG